VPSLAERYTAASSKPGTSGSAGGSSDACSVRAIAERAAYRREFSTAVAAREARLSASARSVSSKRWPVSALTNVITPCTVPWTAIGTTIAEVMPIERSNDRWRSSCAAATSSSSPISG